MFHTLDNDMLVSSQISVADIAAASALGVKMIINNRPDREAPDQTEGAMIEDVTRKSGLDYIAIPVTHDGFSQEQINLMVAAMARAEGKILAYCRSGTRSTLLWALARASQGDDPNSISEKAAHAGYDVGPIRALLDKFASV
jgi:uncharacterized protein (TIGR01244 family)